MVIWIQRIFLGLVSLLSVQIAFAAEEPVKPPSDPEQPMPEQDQPAPVEPETIRVIKVKPLKLEDFNQSPRQKAIDATEKKSSSSSENGEDETRPAPKAVELVDPRVERREITVADIDSQDVEVGAFYGLMSVEDFGVNPVYGAFINYHVTEDIFIGASYGQTTTELTSFERLSGARLLTPSQRDLSYYDLSVGLNLLPGEGYIGKSWAFNSNFYVTAGVGSTKFAGDQRFTLAFSSGYQVVLQDWLAINVELELHQFEIDILGSTKVSDNLSLQAGFSIYF